MLTERQKTIISIIADCDMNISKVADTLYYHRNTVVYHCDKILKKTGLDPRRFCDLVKLVEIVEKEKCRSTNPVAIKGLEEQDG